MHEIIDDVLPCLIESAANLAKYFLDGRHSILRPLVQYT